MAKEEVITIRVNQIDKNKIKLLAKNNNLSISRYLICKGLDIEVNPGVRKELNEISNELKRWGNNLNQLTKRINDHNLQGSSRLKRRTKQQVSEIKKITHQAIDQLDSYLHS